MNSLNIFFLNKILRYNTFFYLLRMQLLPASENYICYSILTYSLLDKKTILVIITPIVDFECFSIRHNPKRITQYINRHIYTLHSRLYRIINKKKALPLWGNDQNYLQAIISIKGLPYTKGNFSFFHFFCFPNYAVLKMFMNIKS